MQLTESDYQFLYPLAESYYRKQKDFTYTEKSIMKQTGNKMAMVESLLFESESKSQIKTAMNEFVSEYHKNPNSEEAGKRAGTKLKLVFDKYC